MALDRRFDLRATERREPSADELVRISREASDLSGKHALLRRGNFAVYVPPSPQEASAEILRTLATRGGNLYAALERHRAVVINPVRPAGSGVLLAGGSFSEVALDVTEAGAVVRKRVRRGETELVDREVRHQQEVEWLAALPPGAAELFPPVRRVVDTETEVGGDFDFVPAYTFAELVFQERVTGAVLAQMLAHVYSTLRGTLYEIPRQPGGAAGPPVGYVERIRRRSEMIERSGHPGASRVMALLTAHSVQVNGEPVVPAAKFLRIVESEPRWDAFRARPPTHTAHGDLILEDILADSSGPAGFRLVDPNPVIGLPLLDVGKTMLSLWLRYEFVYFDLFDLELDHGPDGSLDVRLSFDRAHCLEQYAVAEEAFLAFVQHELGDLLGLRASEVPRHIRMAAALQALAIPMFHLLHHDREDRALAFAALGLWGATQALRER